MVRFDTLCKLQKRAKDEAPLETINPSWTLNMKDLVKVSDMNTLVDS